MQLDIYDWLNITPTPNAINSTDNTSSLHGSYKTNMKPWDKALLHLEKAIIPSQDDDQG